MSSESDRPDINQLQNMFMKNLTNGNILQQFSLVFASKNSHFARIKHCYQYMHDYQLLPKSPFAAKNDETSANYRNDGNKCFVKKQNEKSLILYNKALMYASCDKLISLAYANRSATLLIMKKYKESLLDIERAFEAGYDEELKPKLLKRKLQCEEAIKNVKKVSDEDDIEARKKIFNFTEKRLVGVPCASDLLEISYSEAMGRYVKAVDDITPGQVLVAENPYMTLLLKENYMTRCYFCCSLNEAMIPCKGCPYAMFCNEDCFSQSWNLGHRYECPIMSLLISMDFTKIELLSLQVLLRAKCQHNSLKDLFETIELAEKESDPKLKGFVRDNGSLIYDSVYYTPVHMLETNIQKRDNSDVFQRCFVSTAILSMLIDYTDFFEDSPKKPENILALDESDYVWRAGSLIFHHNMTSASNMHCIGALQQNSQYLYVSDNSFASGAYPFLSLLNHSCSPNVGRVHCGTTVYLLALRPIKKGQQIFDNYGQHHAMTQITTRCFNLEFQYKFTCRCEACSNSWPMYLNLKNANFNSEQKKSFQDIINSDLIENLEKGDKKTAFSIIDALYKCVSVLEEFAPCKELADHQEIIKQCWALFGNIEPYHHSSLTYHFDNLKM